MPSQLTAEDLQAILNGWREKYAQHTRANYTKRLRRFILWLERVAGARPTLSDAVHKVHQPEPRSTIATDRERRQLLTAANPALRFFLLLCADLGLRHKTAAHISISNYDPHLHALSFYTKCETHQTLPVTPEIAAIIESLPPDSNPDTPIVNLLRPAKHPGHAPGPNPRFTKQFTKLKRELDIRSDLHIHDLRRTVAEDVWNATHDIRAVQAQLGHRSPTTTARYLANRISLQDLQPILHKVQKLRAIREQQPAPAPPLLDTAAPQPPPNCPTCALKPYCDLNGPVCQRKEHDA